MGIMAAPNRFSNKSHTQREPYAVLNFSIPTTLHGYEYWSMINAR